MLKKMINMDDKAIISLFLERNVIAISRTKEKYGKRLVRLAYEITEDMQAAEECENDTYYRVWNAIPPHEPYDYFYAFLTHIIRNAALNYCRSRNSKKRKALTEELTSELEDIIPGQNNIEKMIDDMSLKALLNDFLATLSKEKRNVFIRRYWYMDSVERIATGYGISVSKVKSILFRCRNELKNHLKKEGYDL